MFKSALSVLFCILSFSLCTQGQQPGSVIVEFPSQESLVHGRVFPAGGEAPHPTLLLVPGFPGNPNDVVGLGDSLSRLGINVVMFNPRGMWESEGSFSFEHTIEDIGAALRWLERDEVRQRFKIDPGKLTLGGYSYGGGMAMVYAASLADRSILLVGAWEDVQVTVDQTVLPLYLALKRSKAADVRFLVYHADHQFGAVRERLASDIRDWLQQHYAR